jgi:hypothetical protein
MAKVLYFPGVDADPPTRSELVDTVSELMMQEVAKVFIEQRYEPLHLSIWHREIRDFFWAQEIRTKNRRPREEDLQKWRNHWRNVALNYIRTKTSR